VDVRERRGLAIAERHRLTPRDGFWYVPSGSSGEHYRVDPATGCYTCPDFELRRAKCKHLWAVEFTIRRETIRTEETACSSDGAALTVTRTVTEAVRTVETARITYRQDWPAYNAAQTNESRHFPELLHGLCQGIIQPPQGKGRPRLLLADVVFCAVVKVYSTVSGRRAVGDLGECHAKGYIAKVPHYNSTFNYLENPALTPILKALVEESAAPLKAVESQFAVDASGFSTCRFERWYDAKYGRERSERQWIKAHLMCGTKTHIVASVEITESEAHDAPYLPPLLKSTAERFDVAEVSGDKAYLSNRNLNAIVGAGATPYIPFKTNTTGDGPELWRRLFHFYMFNRETFLQHYHRRSNVETVFSMIKGKFGDALRSKTRVAQVNEVLCKVLCHNLCVLIQSIYELGIEPTFWADGPPAQKVPA
jgi:transposase